MKDYYALLGLDQKATKTDIKKNYRRLANKYHPDKSSDPKSAAIFIAITEAYDTLSNTKSRAQYDLSRWTDLKKKKAAKDSFTVVPTPQESTRSRRNKAQHKRSIKYHQAKGEVNETFHLVKECLHIMSRYILHILGLTLLAVILSSAFQQIGVGFDTSIGIGVGTCVLSVVLLWCILRIGLHLYSELKKDIPLFSIYYKIPHRKALFFAVPVFIFVLIIYVSILISYS